MRELNFNVTGQKLIKNGNFQNIIKGTKGYLQCKFVFDIEWTKLKKIAVFESNNIEQAVVLKNDTCLVPDEITKYSCFKVRIVGILGNKRVITNRELIIQGG